MNKDAINASNIPYITIAAFMIGALFSIASILWTLTTTKEIPVTQQQIIVMQKQPMGWRTTLTDIVNAIRDTPLTMKQLAVMKLF